MREVEIERVDRGVDAELGDLAGQDRGRIQMRERGRRRRVGQIVGRHVDRLDRGDRALGGRGDPLLERAHVGAERRLIADRRGDPAEQRRDLRARLGEAEDVVDEQQHVLALGVAEMLRDGEAGEADPGARAGRLVHLAVDQGDLGLRQVLEVDDPGLDHLVVEIVALAGPLADAREHREAAVRLGDVVDQLHDDHGLADAGAAEQADLAALGIGGQQVDHLDPGGQDLGLGRLVDQRRRRLVDRHPDLGIDRPALVDRLADHIQDPAERLAADRHRDRLAGVDHLLAAGEAIGAVHGDRAHGRFAEMLGDLEDQLVAVIVGVQRVQDRRQGAVELDVDDRAHHLGDPAGLDVVAADIVHRGPSAGRSPVPLTQSASAPETISISSLVICA